MRAPLAAALLLALAAQAVGQPVTVDMRDYAFEPHEVRVAVGTAVRWVNHDPAPHSIAMEGGAPGSSGLVAQGREYAFTFQQAGRFTYRCGVHPTMLGVVVVQ